MNVIKEPTDLSYARALTVATELARSAGELLRAEFHRPGGPRGGGGHCDADARAEALMRRGLAEAFPAFGARGEELGDQDRAPSDPAGHVWLIDPNDGTSAYLKGHRESCVSIALLRAGVPVLGVVFAFNVPVDGGELFAWAERCGPVTRNGVPAAPCPWPDGIEAGQTILVSQDADRNSGANAEAVAPARFRAAASIAYRLALVSAGEAIAAVSLNGPCDWDYAAGHALLRGAGGELLDAGGKPVTYEAAGRSHCKWCFGGAPNVVAELARRDWAAVFHRPAHEPAAVEATTFDLASPVAGQVIADPGILSRAQGCLLGQLAGDSLGGLVEFEGPETIALKYPDGSMDLIDGGHWGTIAGQPTDDSEMALMLARCLLEERHFDDEAVATAYAGWYGSRPYDIGFTTSSALSPAYAALRSGQGAAKAARESANRNSQANGSLMRVSPLGIFGHAAEPNVLAGWARADAALTHPHPVCGDGGAVFTVAIARAITTGERPAAVYQFVMEWAAASGIHPDVQATLSGAADRPPEDFCSQMGWMRIALQNAFYQLLHARTFREGVESTILQGGDTDTNAAIAGALLGAVYGAEAVPAQWRDRVLTCRPIPHLHGVRHPRPRAFWPVDALVVAERLLVAGREAGAR
jgi:ADP-ribosylglycohydrolase/fructose-1,6-bisphosphatase/inositol monophosphatase family enzyme